MPNLKSLELRNTQEGPTNMALLAVALLIGVVVLACMWSSKQADAERIRYEQEWTAACNDPEVLKIVEELCGDQLPSIEVPPVSLQRGEFCFYITEVDH